MATTQKALSIMAYIAEELKLRLPSLAQTEGFDSDQSPTLLVGAAAAGSAGGFIKVRPINWPEAKDVLGNTAIHYGPHVVQLVTEANPAGGAGADINTAAQLGTLLGVCIERGCRFEWYEETNGAAVGAADITGAKLKLTFDPSVRWGFIANQ